MLAASALVASAWNSSSNALLGTSEKGEQFSGHDLRCLLGKAVARFRHDDEAHVGGAAAANASCDGLGLAQKDAVGLTRHDRGRAGDGRKRCSLYLWLLKHEPQEVHDVLRLVRRGAQQRGVDGGVCGKVPDPARPSGVRADGACDVPSLFIDDTLRGEVRPYRE